MRIIFLALFAILGANLMIEMLDSNMTQIIKDRNESIQRSINNLWKQQPQRIQFKLQKREDLHLFWRRFPHVQQHIKESKNRIISYQNG